MKKAALFLGFLMVSFILILPLQAQVRGNGEVVKQERTVEPFTGVKVDGAKEVVLIQGDQHRVEVETDANLQEYVEVMVVNNTLEFKTTKPIIKYQTMRLIVTSPTIEKVKVSGASDIRSQGQLKGDELKLNVSGASEANLDLDYQAITSVVSGASDVVLSGKAGLFTCECSGASDVKAKSLEAGTAVINASGASNCAVNVSHSLTYNVSGAADVNYAAGPQAVVVKNGKNAQVVTYNGTQMAQAGRYADTTSFSMGSVNFEVVDGDTTVVAVGRHRLIVSDDGDVRWERNRHKKFNGHWGGVDIGLNGYLTPNFDMNFDKADDYLDLQMEKSINLNLNLYEENIQLSKKHDNFGLITGLGLSWNNYRFNHATFLTPDSSDIHGYYMEGISVRKSKLTSFYLTVPVFFEVQTNHKMRTRRFHMAVGGIVGLRLNSHTKVYFNESNKEFRLTDVQTGETVQFMKSPSLGNRNIVKDFDSYHLAPFKFDVSARFGYGIVNLYVTYSLNTMFQKDRGPELYPFSAGISLVGW
ncbi:MAG: DUF2807 domain-containing protein [Bacteroidales bacterium]|nr:DUF2807 domain-containing protein [Bacteroidales bacterium]